MVSLGDGMIGEWLFLLTETMNERLPVEIIQSSFDKTVQMRWRPCIFVDKEMSRDVIMEEEIEKNERMR